MNSCCGTLCCDSCSTKRLQLKSNETNNNHTASSSNSNSPKDHNLSLGRTCDSCFNLLVFEAFTRNQEILKAKKDLEKAEIEEKRLQDLQPKSKLIGTNATISSKLLKQQESSDVMSETMQGLVERGEKLAETAIKAEELNEVFYRCDMLLLVYLILILND